MTIAPWLNLLATQGQSFGAHPVERLDRPKRLAEWLERVELAPETPPGQADLDRARTLRSALRAVALASVSGSPPPADQLETVRGFLTGVTGAEAVELVDGRLRLPRPANTGKALKRLAHQAIQHLTGPDRHHLRVCAEHDCRREPGSVCLAGRRVPTPVDQEIQVEARVDLQDMLGAEAAPAPVGTRRRGCHSARARRYSSSCSSTASVRAAPRDLQLDPVAGWPGTALRPAWPAGCGTASWSGETTCSVSSSPAMPTRGTDPSPSTAILYLGQPRSGNIVCLAARECAEVRRGTRRVRGGRVLQCRAVTFGPRERREAAGRLITIVRNGTGVIAKPEGAH